MRFSYQNVSRFVIMVILLLAASCVVAGFISLAQYAEANKLKYEQRARQTQSDLASTVGQKIVGLEYKETSAKITLEDGRVIRFQMYGKHSFAAYVDNPPKD